MLYSMTASRSRLQVKAYNKHRKEVEPADKVCAFCEVGPDSPQFISETTHFKLIKNIFPYSIWDNHPVNHHLLLTPKVHTDSLADLPDKADIEYVKLISEYESKGYNIYARAAGSDMKSIAHQHTHLIKPEKKFVKFLLYVSKPYIRWVVK